MERAVDCSIGASARGRAVVAGATPVRDGVVSPSCEPDLDGASARVEGAGGSSERPGRMASARPSPRSAQTSNQARGDGSEVGKAPAERAPDVSAVTCRCSVRRRRGGRSGDSSASAALHVATRGGWGSPARGARQSLFAAVARGVPEGARELTADEPRPATVGKPSQSRGAIRGSHASRLTSARVRSFSSLRGNDSMSPYWLR